MSEISKEVNIEILEKLSDGTFKKKNPATKAEVVKFADGSTVEDHKADRTNPHRVTKEQVGLSNVDNVKQATKAEFDMKLNGNTLALGQNAEAGRYAIALGKDAKALKDAAISIGDDVVTGEESVTLGTWASSKDFAAALGAGTQADYYATALGWVADAGYNSVAIGADARAEGEESVLVGTNAQNLFNDFVTVLGCSASAGEEATALGYVAEAADISVALGAGTRATEAAAAIGWAASAYNNNEGVLGGSASYETCKWRVPGSFTVSGTKKFEIPHPKPEKQATHVIRHGAVESPTAGDTLYRWRVQANKDNDLVTIDLPDYFIWLNKNVQIFVTPQGHFGNGYGELNRETEQLEIHCQYTGEYNVLAIGTRNDDHQSVKDWDIKGVEREIGESWAGETYVFEVEELIEVEEIKEVAQ